MLPKPISPYPNVPFGTDKSPITAVPYDVDTPELEVVDKGTFFFHELTKSTLSAPSCYTLRDVCGNEFYMKGGVSFNNNLLFNCVVTPIFQGSLSATIPVNMTRAEFDNHVETMGDTLWTSVQTANFTQLRRQIA